MIAALKDRFQVLPHWRLLSRAWSTRMLALSALLSSINEGMPEAVHHVIGPYLGVAIWLASVIGLVARYIKQFDLPTPATEAEPTEGDHEMKFLETLEQDVAARVETATKDAEAMIAAAKKAGGLGALKDGVALLPAADQPLGNAIIGLWESPDLDTAVAALKAAYQIYEGAKAEVPPGYAPIEPDLPEPVGAPTA